MIRRLAVRVVGAVALTTATMAALTTPAVAAPAQPPAPAEVAPQVLRAMQRDLGLTAEQATARLGQEQRARALRDRIRDELGGEYGGSFFDGETGRLVVGATSAPGVAAARAAGADSRLVAHSADQLNSIVDALDTRSGDAPEGVTGWGVDPRSNTVVVRAQRGAGERVAPFVRAVGADERAVRVVESSETPRPLEDIIGGNPYTIGATGRCSIGFAVQGGFVTAGHCGDQGETTSGPAGTFADSVFPGNDYAWVRTDSARPTPTVNGYGQGDVTVGGSAEAPVGSSVCRSGSTTGWHCGSVQALNQSVRYPEGSVNGLTRTDVCAEPGDSGGSFVSGDQAQGTTSGGSGDCASGGTTYFQPVNPALRAFGLQLVTAGGQGGLLPGVER